MTPACSILPLMSTDNSDAESEGSDYEDIDDGVGYYDDFEADITEREPTDPATVDPEHFEYTCLAPEDVEGFFNDSVESLCASLPIKPSLAKLLLHTHRWAASEIITAYKKDASKLLIDSRIKPSKPPEDDTQTIRNSSEADCSVCLLRYAGECFHGLACGHLCCKDCWCSHFEMQINQRITTSMECMGHLCSLLVPEDFVLNILNKSILRKKYQLFSFSDYVKSHPNMRFCPGTDCKIVIFAKECQTKCVVCKQCDTSFCFKCGGAYHAPTDCDTIKKWQTKCSDDSETANYIAANTKDCPKCNVCIEKNGGCNHMRCTDCKFEFCWMCRGDWVKTHGHAHATTCNRYEEDPNASEESPFSQAREALKKYLFYFERWDNHARSLRLEEQTYQKIKNQINAKVMASEGTWIDWQYLSNAASVLAKCRYTLQYTYPYAFFMESGPRKKLFEYQQAELEAEIENLSWKIENAADKGEIQNQVDVAEKRRTTLLKDFLSP